MRNKYLLGGGVLLGLFIFLAFSPLTHGAIGTLEDAWKAITKLQTDLKNVQFTSGLPGPKTIELMNNVLISSSNGSPGAEMNTRWFEVSGGYNTIAFDVKKSGGSTESFIRGVFIDFTNDPANPNTPAWSEQAKLECQQTKCTLTSLPLLAKFYRLRVSANSGIRVSAYGYVSTDGLPGPKGPQGLTGPKGDKGDSGDTSQISILTNLINALEARIAKLEGNNPPPPPPPAKNVAIALSPTNPASYVIASGTVNNTVTKFKITNGTSSAKTISKVTLTRGGIISDSNVTAVGVFDSSNNRHGNFASFGSSVATIDFTSEPISVQANASTEIIVKVNFSDSITVGTISVGINQASDITLDGTTMTGTFPMFGNTHSIITGSNVIGSAILTSKIVQGGTESSPTITTPGTNNYDVQKFRIMESTGIEDIKLTALNIENNGLARDGDYVNIKLKDSANNILSTVAQSTNNKFKFVLTTPLSITKGTFKDLTISVDIPLVNDEIRLLDFTIQDPYDVELQGVNTGSGLFANEAGSSTYPIGDGIGGDLGNYVQFGTEPTTLPLGEITLKRSPDSPTSGLVKGSTDQTLAVFDLNATGEDIVINKITFVVSKDGTAELTTGNHSLVGNFKIKDENGDILYSANPRSNLLYSSDGTFTISNNSITNTGAGAAKGTEVTLSNSKVVKAGISSKILFVADIFQGAQSSDEYTINVQGYKAFRQTTQNYIVNTSNESGFTRQVLP